MTIGKFLDQTVTRYQRARRLVLDTYPHPSEVEFRALVREAVQCLANQEKARKVDAPKQPTAAHNLHRAAEALRHNDDRAAVRYIERAKQQLLEEQESYSLDLALTANGVSQDIRAPRKIQTLLRMGTRFQWFQALQIACRLLTTRRIRR